MTDIPRYNAPRGTTLCEAVGGELVMAADHDVQVSALRAALHSCAKASSAAEVGLIVDEVLAASRARQALAPENQRVVPAEPLMANPHPFDKPPVPAKYLVSYFHSQGRGRSFANLDRGGVPTEQNLRDWEQKIEANTGLHQVGITAFHLISASGSDTRNVAQANRIPAGLYAELEALRTLRDATGVYLQGYMRDEIEDEDNCVTEDQHDAACTVKLALDKAKALEWKGGGDA